MRGASSGVVLVALIICVYQYYLCVSVLFVCISIVCVYQAPLPYIRLTQLYFRTHFAECPCIRGGGTGVCV